MKYIYSSLSRVGLKRTENEDSLGVFKLTIPLQSGNEDNGLLIVVCDGLGGNNAGEVASKLTVDTIYSHFKDSTENDFLARIKNSINEANRAVNESSLDNLSYKGMATTVEVLFIRDNEAFWGHVGDSRIYYFRNGKIKQITKDHSLVQKLVDEGFLTVKEAENHPNKNIITRAIGDSSAIDIDLSKIRFSSRDDTSFFVCTDGVTTVINDNELEEIFRGNKIDFITQEIAHLVEERGAPDNYSFVIISKTE